MGNPLHNLGQRSNVTDATDTNVSDSDILWAIKRLLEERLPHLGIKVEQLRSQCTEEDQRRIGTHPEYERGTIERWAWHAGYVVCLGSIVHLIDQQLAQAHRQRRSRESGQVDRAPHRGR